MDEEDQMKNQIIIRNKRLRMEIDLEIDNILGHIEKIKELREMFLDESTGDQDG